MREGQPAWFLDAIGDGFTVVVFGEAPDGAPPTCGGVTARVLSVGRDLTDAQGVLAQRYDARAGTTYLIRPAQHVAARWRRFDRVAIEAALRRCLAA